KVPTTNQPSNHPTIQRTNHPTIQPSNLQSLIPNLRPITLRNRLNLLLRQPHLAQNGGDEIGFTVEVAVDVVGELGRQSLLERAVLAGGVGMGAEVVAHGEVVAQAQA